MQESKIIDFVQQLFPIIGDDAAFLFGNQVISKDLLVEDIHFRRRYCDAESLAHKALHVNLSDIAAMGGKPSYVLLGLAIPRNYDNTYVDKFLSSFAKACFDTEVVLVGGDTTASPDKLFISITVIGTVDKPVYRNSAEVGDIICYVGNLGHAYLGLQALENNIAGLDVYKQASLRPIALVQEGLKLKDKATAMIDISDGLYIDLQKLCKASKVSAQIDLENLKIDEDFAKACDLLKLDPLSSQLIGGEDYGLLFTIKPDQYTSAYQKIGIIIEGNGKICFNQEFNLKQKIFSHFGEL